MKDYSLGNFISALREKKGLSQYQLGALVGVTDKAVSKWENGASKPRINTVKKLAQVLDVGIDELLTCEYATFGRKRKDLFAMKNDILKGQRFIIFPEAGYKDNKNALQDFHTPAFSLAIKTKCPIIPFCLYDSWKAYNKDYAGYYKLQFQCHILPPIYYDEYKDLNKRELAALVKSRIQNKLDEIKNNSLSQ